ncbi:MAG: hypothetical protein ABFS56_03510 [Pseudomonadota bacterium]
MALSIKFHACLNQGKEELHKAYQYTDNFVHKKLQTVKTEGVQDLSWAN